MKYIVWCWTCKKSPNAISERWRPRSACDSVLVKLGILWSSTYTTVYIQSVSGTLRKHAYSNIWKISPPKTENFQIKISAIFHISVQNIDCGYSLEPPRRGGSNEYPQYMFFTTIRKIMYTPVNPSFTIQKWGLRGSKLYRRVLVMKRRPWSACANRLTYLGLRCPQIAWGPFLVRCASFSHLIWTSARQNLQYDWQRLGSAFTSTRIVRVFFHPSLDSLEAVEGTCD